MATISKMALSGSTDAVGFTLAIDSGTFTTIHTGPSVAADFDEVWIYGSNINTTAETVSITWGTTSGDTGTMKTVIQANETVLLVPGWVIKGNASTALIIKGASTTASKVNVVGYVNRIDDA